jgi:hypothetical protein
MIVFAYGKGFSIPLNSPNDFAPESTDAIGETMVKNALLAVFTPFLE